MIPYFISLFLLGIPLMWIEWALGRYGGGFGHGTAPGIFHTMWEKNRFIKYFGVIGIFGPLVIFIYYTYIESWTLGYSVFSVIRYYHGIEDQATMQSFLRAYQGLERNSFFVSMAPAIFFFLITFIANIAVIYYGIRGGIEKLCKIAMPLLFILGLIIMIRVLTLGTPNLSRPSWNISNGMGFLWNPDFTALMQPKVWLAAAGQMFFTLSVGIGAILTYASYLKKGDDVVLSGLSAVSTNEFIEVILGGSIIIPAAFVFFGPIGIKEVAMSGAFNLSFVTMPMIFQKIMFGAFFGSVWFLLLFLAGITSSVSLAQPAIAFLEDEFNLTRKKAVIIFSIVAFLCCLPSIFLLKKGVVNELDFWGGTFCLVLFATVEAILFTWVFGMDKAWDEIHHGADFAVPKIYRFIMKYVTPLFLILILVSWLIKDGMPVILMRDVAAADRPFVLGTRLFLITLFIIVAILVKIAWKKRRLKR
jgi:SNF family Na+-dependent transporter